MGMFDNRRAWVYSAVGHGLILAVSLISFFARPYESHPTESLSVDIISSDQMAKIAKGIESGDKKVKAFPLAGHTPGSYAFLYDGVLFVGDAIQFKQGRLDPPMKLFESNLDASKAAIRELNKTVEKEEFEIVCTGHGGCTPKGLGRNLLSDLAGRV